MLGKNQRSSRPQMGAHAAATQNNSTVQCSGKTERYVVTLERVAW